MGFKIDDLVWAKMNRCPYWPARIVKPDPKIKAPRNKQAYKFVCFFGTDDVAWIPIDCIIPHTEDSFNSDMAKKQSKPLQNAIEDLKEYLKLPVGDLKAYSSKVKDKLENKTKPSKKSVENQEQQGSQAMAVAGADGNKSSLISPKKRDALKNTSRGKKQSLEEAGPSKSVVGKQQFFDPDMPGTSAAMDISEPIRFDQKFGFIGLTETGTAILEKFIRCGMDITLWDEANKHKKFAAKGKRVSIVNSPSELICKCDITFCCLESDVDGFENIISGTDGILMGFEKAEKLGRRPGYVGLANVDPEMSKHIQSYISTKNGMYLDAPIVFLDHTESFDTCSMYISAAGDQELFNDCEKCLKVISENCLYASYDIDINSNANMLLNSISGTSLLAISETMVLAERLGMFEKDSAMKVIPSMLEMDSVIDVAERMVQDSKNSQAFTPMKHVQKNIDSALDLAEEVSQAMPCTAAANESYKHAMLNYSEADVSAMFKAMKS